MYICGTTVGGDPIIINPKYVCTVRQITENETVLEMVSGKTIAIASSLADILEDLEDAK